MDKKEGQQIQASKHRREIIVRSGGRKGQIHDKIMQHKFKEQKKEK